MCKNKHVPNNSNTCKKSDFIYDAEKDQYTCPTGALFHRTGKKKQHYSNRRACKNCELKELCNKNNRGRQIERTEYEKAFEASVARFSENKDLYKQRQMLVEHPFGTIKRTLGFTYFLTRGLENVKAENQLHMLTYNIKRVLNIFSTPDLIRLLKEIRSKAEDGSLCFYVFNDLLRHLMVKTGMHLTKTLTFAA